MNKLLPITLLAALAFAGCDSLSAGDTMPFSKVEEAESLRVRVSGTTVIRERSEWEAFWHSHVSWTGSDGEPIPPPPVDFERQTVLGVFYGGAFHAGCHSAVDVIRNVEQEGSTLEVHVAALPDLGLCRAVAYPLDVVVVDVAPSQALDVRFKGRVP